MNNFRISLFKIFILLCTLLFIFCNQDYNPFQDLNNTRLYIVGQSFKANDTLQIFSRESLTVMISVPEFAEMLTVTTHGNRLFKDGTTISYSAKDNKISKGPYVIAFSFVDTGRNSISLQLMRSDRTSFPIEIPFYVKTPLSKNRISGNYKENFTFKVDSVKDHDLVYEWQIEGLRNIESPVPEIKNVVLDGLTGKIRGTIVVHDRYYRSQSITFLDSLNDTYKPEISYVENRYLHGDTILYNPENLQFVFVITDIGCGVENSVSINGIRSELNDSLLVKEFSTPPDSIEIVVSDRSQNHNTTKKRFFVKADASVQKATSVQLSVIAPFRDTSFSEFKEKQIFGEVKLLGKNATINHKVTVVSQGKSQSKQLTGGTQQYWQIPVSLENGVNPIAITLRNDADSVVCLKNIVIQYQPGIKDTTLPEIVDIAVDSSRSGSVYQTIVSNKIAKVKLVVYDQESNIDSVRFGSVALHKVDSCEYLWGGDIPLVSGINNFAVQAVNSNKLVANRNIIIVKNYPPVYVNSLSAYKEVVKGNVYHDSMIVTDLDGDKISYAVDTSVSRNASINQNGFLTYNAIGSDTLCKLKCTASDPFELVEEEVVIKIVSDSSKISHKVTFKTEFIDLPSIVEIDTVYKIILECIDNGGGRTVNYSFAVNSKYSFLSISGDTLLIKPLSLDTGYVQCTIIASGENRTYDTLSAMIRVVSKNLPPVITPDSSMYSNGALQLFIRHIDTISVFPFKVTDPESLYTKAPTVKLFCKNPNVLLSQKDNQNYRITVMRSENVNTSDTIEIRCSDAQGLYDTLLIPVLYENTDTMLSAVSPKEAETIFNDTVVFSWHKSVSNNFTCILEYGLCNDSIVSKEVVDTIVKIPVKTTGLYRWRVYVKDSKNHTSIPYRTFSVRVPNHLTFETGRNEIDKTLYAEVDTLSLKLKFVNSTGVSPITISGYRQHDTLQSLINIINKDSVFWIPGKADTGANLFTFIAIDSNKNRDTITGVVNVIPTPDITIDVYTADNELLKGNQVDLSESVTDQILKVKLRKCCREIKDTFTIEIASSKYATVTKADSAELVLKKGDPITQSNDTLRITVSSHNGLYKKSLSIVVLYQKSYKKIIVDTRSTPVGGDLENIPVLVHLDSTNFSFSDKKPGFRFVKNQSTDTLPYQINSWNVQSKTGEIWVLFDNVKDNSSDTVLMYYGLSIPDRSNGNAVFDTSNGFTGVWHLEEQSTGTGPYIINDATANSNNGEAHIWSTSEIDKKNGFGNSKKISSNFYDRIIIDSTKGYRNSLKSMTIDTWIYGNGSPGIIFSIKLSSAVYCYFKVGAGVPVLQFMNNMNCSGLSGLKASTWNHVAAVFECKDGSSDTTLVNCKLYSNGVGLSKVLKFGSFTMNVDSCAIGPYYEGFSETYSGYVDEVRLSSVTRQDAWMKFSYENGKSGSTIVSVKD